MIIWRNVGYMTPAELEKLAATTEAGSLLPPNPLYGLRIHTISEELMAAMVAGMQEYQAAEIERVEREHMYGEPGPEPRGILSDPEPRGRMGLRRRALPMLPITREIADDRKPWERQVSSYLKEATERMLAPAPPKRTRDEMADERDADVLIEIDLAGRYRKLRARTFTPELEAEYAELDRIQQGLDDRRNARLATLDDWRMGSPIAQEMALSGDPLPAPQPGPIVTEPLTMTVQEEATDADA